MVRPQLVSRKYTITESKLIFFFLYVPLNEHHAFEFEFKHTKVPRIRKFHDFERVCHKFLPSCESRIRRVLDSNYQLSDFGLLFM